MHHSCDRDIMVRGTDPMCAHWIRDSCLSYFWELLYLTARSAGICVAMAGVPVGQAAQRGLVVWLTGWLAVLGSGARKKAQACLQAEGSWLAEGSSPEAAANSRLCWRWLLPRSQAAHSLKYGHSWYILMWRASTACITIFSVAIEHDYGYF